MGWFHFPSIDPNGLPFILVLRSFTRFSQGLSIKAPQNYELS